MVKWAVICFITIFLTAFVSYAVYMLPGKGNVNGLYCSPAQHENINYKHFVVIMNGNMKQFKVYIDKFEDDGIGTLDKLNEDEYRLTLNYPNFSTSLIVIPSQFGFDISEKEAKRLDIPIENFTWHNIFAKKFWNIYGRYNLMYKVK